MQILRAAVFFGGEEDLNQPSRTGKLAVYLFLYIPVVWAALLLAQSLGGGLPAMEGRSLVPLIAPLSLGIEELIFVTCESRSDREPFFPLFS